MEREWNEERDATRLSKKWNYPLRPYPCVARRIECLNGRLPTVNLDTTPVGPVSVVDSRFRSQQESCQSPLYIQAIKGHGTEQTHSLRV